jgi:hypothetical protein
MNERIRELKEQAREYATTRHPVSNITLSVNSDLFEQKFAELIVRECYEHCKGQLLNSTLANEHNLSYNDGVADCAIGLLQHFGVEL